MKPKDNQITGREFDQHLYIRNGYSRTCYGWKNIPIKHLEELVNIPPQDITLTNIEWIDVKGIDTPFLVTLIEREK